jgi:predicted alpha/beta hydrolase family esterase
MSRTIILPGIGGSGSEHWQTIWEAQDAGLKRFSPTSWDYPELEDWIAALDTAVARSVEPPVLVAHSLACLLVAHWQARNTRAVAGALLVAVPDPAGPAFPVEAASFADPPDSRFRFPCVIVASGNDPYGSLPYARLRAEQWGSRLVEAGDHGHINGASGLGAWPAGRAVLNGFMADLAKT